MKAASTHAIGKGHLPLVTLALGLPDILDLKRGAERSSGSEVLFRPMFDVLERAVPGDLTADPRR